MARSSEAKVLVGTLNLVRAAVRGAVETPEREGVVAPVLEEIDRAVAALDPTSTAAGRRDRIEIERHRKDEQRAARIEDELLATLSHELRTPLNAILGWSRLMRMGKLDGRGTARAIEAIERNAQAQAQLIDDLLDLSRLASGKLRVEVRPVEAGPVVDAAIASVRHAAEAKGIGISARIDADLPRIAGDPARLEQIVWNLLSNAIKFTPRGGGVRLRARRAGERDVEIEVADDGRGICAEFLPFVFDRFRQADGTTTRENGGLGLGLAIVRHLVDLHGGEVRAESDGEGTGSVFTVRLPIATARTRRSGPPADVSGIDLMGDGSQPLRGLSVLVVDDEVDAREHVTTVLREHGAGVTAVGSVPEALLAIEQHKPDVMVSDIAMPSEDAYTLIRQVRALEKRIGRIPAAAITAYAGVQDRTRALLAGYSSHLPKPVEAAELTAVVANLAGRTANG